MHAWFENPKKWKALLFGCGAPKSSIDAAVKQFLSDTASIADDAALVIDRDLRMLIGRLAPQDAAQYESVVRVPGAFPPYLVWAALAAFDALPLADTFEPAMANRVERRLLETAAQTRGMLNAKLLSALLYQLQRGQAEGHSPLDSLVPRFWEEVQRMGALSNEGSDILATHPIAHETLAKRLLAASSVRSKLYDGSFWMTVRESIEQEAART